MTLSHHKVTCYIFGIGSLGARFCLNCVPLSRAARQLRLFLAVIRNAPDESSLGQTLFHSLEHER